MTARHEQTLSRFLRRFTLAELLSLTLLASLGIAVKPLVMPAVRLLAHAVLLPTGAAAGGFYMLWVVLGAVIVRKAGSATLVALTQALIVAITGIPGSHGPISLLTYVLPGLAADMAIAVTPAGHAWLWRCLTGGTAASVCGMVITNVVFYRLGAAPLAIASAGAAASGAAGGIIAWVVARRIRSSLHFAGPAAHRENHDELPSGN